MGVTKFDVIQARAFLGLSFPGQGNTYFVRPGTGSDGASGKSPERALKTLPAALAKATANQNDVVMLMAESNSAAGSATAPATTDYQSTQLDWNKDLVHLVGVYPGSSIAQRARIAAISTYTSALPPLKISANACRIENLHVFMGVVDTTPLGAVQVTGSRNKFKNCHIAGIGNDANDIAGAYSLNLSGAAENDFIDCEIGLDTIARGTGANCELLIDTAAARNKFKNCTFRAMLEHATNHPLVRLTGATAIDRTLEFIDCMFINESVNYGIAQAGVFKFTTNLTQGFIIIRNPMTNPSDNSTAVKWDVDDRNQIALFNAPTPAADTAGVARMV